MSATQGILISRHLLGRRVSYNRNIYKLRHVDAEVFPPKPIRNLEILAVHGLVKVALAYKLVRRCIIT